MLIRLEKKRRWISDRLVQYVDIVFGVVVGQSIIRYIDLIQHPLSQPFATMALLVVVVTVTLSWIGYHKSMYEYPYKVDNLSFQSLSRSASIIRPFLDFLIVVAYNFFLFTIDGFRTTPADVNLFPFIASYVLFFTLYYADGMARIAEYEDSLASKLDISGRYLTGYLIVLALYASTIGGLAHFTAPWSYSLIAMSNWVFLLACGFFMLRYRRAREPHYTPTTPFSKKKLTIVVDVDGVLADQVTPVLDELNNQYGSHYVKDDIRHWDEPLPLAHTDIKTAIEGSHKKAEFVKNMQPISNAAEVVRDLSKYFEISIATNRTAVANKPTQEWLRAKNIAHHQYHNTSLEGKGKVDGDIIIDDYPKNIVAFTAKGDRKGILLTQPWNESDTTLLGREDVYRAKDWEEVWKIINSLDPFPI